MNPDTFAALVIQAIGISIFWVAILKLRTAQLKAALDRALEMFREDLDTLEKSWQSAGLDAFQEIGRLQEENSGLKVSLERLESDLQTAFDLTEAALRRETRAKAQAATYAQAAVRLDKHAQDIAREVGFLVNFHGEIVRCRQGGVAAKDPFKVTLEISQEYFHSADHGERLREVLAKWLDQSVDALVLRAARGGPCQTRNLELKSPVARIADKSRKEIKALEVEVEVED